MNARQTQALEAIATDTTKRGIAERALAKYDMRRSGGYKNQVIAERNAIARSFGSVTALRAALRTADLQVRNFYVTARDGDRVAWLLGPFDTHQQALDRVEEGKRLAIKADPFAHFYGFGTSSYLGENPPISVFS